MWELLLILIFNIIIFSLFLAVQRYNILKLVKFNINTGSLIYSKVINQLFIDLDLMELYLIGLFFLKRNEHSQTTCIEQIIIMIIVIFLIATYSILLNQVMASLFKHLPVILSGVEQPYSYIRKTLSTP